MKTTIRITTTSGTELIDVESPTGDTVKALSDAIAIIKKKQKKFGYSKVLKLEVVAFSTLPTGWVSWKELALSVDMADACLSTMGSGKNKTVIRKVKGGKFAVIACDDIVGKILKLLPTLDEAKQYQAAMHDGKPLVEIL